MYRLSVSPRFFSIGIGFAYGGLECDHTHYHREETTAKEYVEYFAECYCHSFLCRYYYAAWLMPIDLSHFCTSKLGQDLAATSLWPMMRT